jgi:anti-sigma factor RsiW
MNCSQHDLKAYLLGELAEPERRPVEEHLRGCRDCREEAERLRLTESALRSLADEEVPRKIAFVSDKIFEPKGWAWLWNSAPRLGFASAAVLALAILVHGLMRPAPVAAPVAMDTQALEARIGSEVARRLEAAVAQSGAQQSRQVAQMVAAVERKLEQQRQGDLLAVDESFKVLQKRINVQYRASLDIGGKP